MHTRTHTKMHTKRPKGSFYFVATVLVSPPVVTTYPAGVLQSDQSFWNHKSPKIWSRKKNIKIKKIRQTENMVRTNESSKKKKIPGVKCSWWAGVPTLGNYPESLQVRVKRSSAELPRIQQPKQVSRNMAASVWPLLTSVTPSTFRPQPIVLPSSTSHLFPASALLDNTPSIWRWRTTHVHNKTTSSKEKTKQGNYPLALPWSETLFFFFALIFVICKNFFTFYLYKGLPSFLHRSSSRAGNRNQGEGLLCEDKSVTFKWQD